MRSGAACRLTCNLAALLLLLERLQTLAPGLSAHGLHRKPGWDMLWLAAQARLGHACCGIAPFLPCQTPVVLLSAAHACDRVHVAMHMLSC